MNQSERDLEMTRLPHQTGYIYRLRFSRSGSLAYIGHLDLMRTFERAFRRSGLCLMHSQGYNPRPIMVFALPLGVGIESDRDYLDVSFVLNLAVQDILSAVRPCLPPDLSIISGWQTQESKGSIMALVSAATYRLEAPGIVCAIKSLLQKEEIIVKKKSKGQIRSLDIRPLILDAIAKDPIKEDDITVVVLAGSHENLRPDLLLSALVEYAGYSQDLAANCRVIRTGLFAGVYPNLKTFEELDKIC